jgi:tetratricopeptide (TPR) repeat protein
MVMSAPKKAKVLETVVVTEDLPEYGIKAGEKAVVLEAFDSPEEAYLLEVVDESGTSSKIADWVKPHQIKDVKSAAKEFLDQGFALLWQGNFPEAEKVFRQAISLYPKDISNIGESIRRSFTPPKNLADARMVVRLYEICFRLAPTHDITRYNLAVSYHHYGRRLESDGKTEEALEAFHQALLATSRPELIEAVSKSVTALYTNLAIKTAQDGDLRAALDYFRAAFQVRSDEITRANLAEAYFNLAELCLSESNLPEAIGMFEEALLAGYLEPALYNDYALALAKVGRMEDAISVLEKGYDLAPDNETIKHNLQMARTAVDDFQREVYEIQFELIPTQEYPLQEYPLAA